MQNSRETIIIRTSIIGILANIALASFKAFAGLFSHSIAIILDAVNNLTDALSSLVTIIGTKLAGKPADKQHPFGHGRAEYLSAMVISVIILYAGFTSLVESVKKIISPQTPDYSKSTLIVVSAAIIIKFLLGIFVKATGKKVNSDSLTASGQDAFMDSMISLTTFIAAIVFIYFNISLESYLGLLISFVILKSGFETLRETLSKILGERINAEISHSVKKTITSVEPEINGAFDLVLNNYGPDKHLGSVHIEIPDTWTADKIDMVSRKITQTVYEKHNIIVTAVGIYSINTKHNSAAQIREKVWNIVHEHKDILQMHGFFIDEANKIMRFDIIVSFDSPDMHIMYNHVVDDVKQAFPDYDIQVQFDFDISD
ncbi:cation diffusion facilitator family transporter [Treponema sp.]|uniref:cation diffusion facilitator family transporter n=1 Tax=Treponema sp. TaxID=166 RepID=UPI00388EA446